MKHSVTREPVGCHNMGRTLSSVELHCELCKVFVQKALEYTLTKGGHTSKQNNIKTTGYGTHKLIRYRVRMSKLLYFLESLCCDSTSNLGLPTNSMAHLR